MRNRLGITSQKILLLLFGGLALGFSGSPHRYKRVLKDIGREWDLLTRHELYRSIRRLYEAKMIRYQEHEDGSITIVLNKHGKEQALKYRLDEMKIKKPKAWDRKWRVILFDIPESIKVLRDTLRIQLKKLGLIELQKSVFIHPYECRDEIDFVIELYKARRYVRFIEAVSIDNELHIKKKFDLI